MANVKETANWEAGVYQLETSDPVLGGENGIDNLQAMQLANRTLWLKTELAKAVASIGSNKAAADQTYALKATTLTAGSGLSGGGTLGGNRVLSLGTPSKISDTSTNVAVSDTHTHEIDKASTTTAGIVKLNDTLSSTSTTEALTANQGRLLDHAKADKAATLAGYGITDAAEQRALHTSNLDSITNPGLYGQGTNANATSARNYPANEAGSLIVAGGAYGVQQLYMPFYRLDIWKRNQTSSGGWTAWQKINTAPAELSTAVSDIENVKADKATTLSGYGITDGVTQSALNATIKSLINGAPGALDTLHELATALDNDANFANTVAAKIGQAAPAGTVAYVAGSAAPAGWLKANGAAVSRTTYAALYAAIGTRYGAGDGSTTFNVPDLRGEFVRGWDDGRGVDSGRTFGSQQGDAIRNITGTFNLLESRGLTATGAFKQKSDILVNTSFRSPGRGADFVVELDASGAVPTAAENRPRNIALLACIKI